MSLAALAAVVSLLAGAAASDAPREVFRWQDPRIAESSGLVDLGEVRVGRPALRIVASDR